jgi:hypothetical protein
MHDAHPDDLLARPDVPPSPNNQSESGVHEIGFTARVPQAGGLCVVLGEGTNVVRRHGVPARALRYHCHQRAGAGARDAHVTRLCGDLSLRRVVHQYHSLLRPPPQQTRFSSVTMTDGDVFDVHIVHARRDAASLVRLLVGPRWLRTPWGRYASCS